VKKIISLFQRDYETDARLVRDEITPGAAWVTHGQGSATVKHDGTCCLVRDRRLYKRYDAKHGKTPPAGFEPAEDAADPVTGHWPGWLPVGDAPEDRWHREAFAHYRPSAETLLDCTPVDGTYELCGPKVQGNPERLERHILIPHGSAALHDAPRDYAGLTAYLAGHDIEGIVSPTHRWTRVGLPSLTSPVGQLSGFPSDESESIPLGMGPGDVMSSRQPRGSAYAALDRPVGGYPNKRVVRNAPLARALKPFHPKVCLDAHPYYTKNRAKACYSVGASS